MGFLRTLFALLVALAILKQSRAQPNSGNTENNMSVRLPTTLKPLHYLLRLHPFINGNFSINGYAEITFEVMEETDKIVLHINDIITQNDTVKVYEKDSPEKSIAVTNQEFDPVRQFYSATLQNMMTKGVQYTLAMNYVAYLNSDLSGFYRSSYISEDGTTRWIATTQMQATDARKAFPCFDEPALKANYSIEMIRQDNMSSISNMPILESIPAEGLEGWMLDRFQTSHPMSSYLVAFIVSDFDYITSTDSPNYEFRIYARKEYIDQAEFALSLGPPSSQFFEDFFQVPFPLPKQDMAAVPDFSAGAMENWGLIIYREARLLMIDTLTKARDKQAIGTVIAHELAHMWFGDLVTPAWWNDLWLNEGFASYMEYIGLQAVRPEMNILQQFVVGDMQTAFYLDCLESSHPVSVEVNNPDEINQLFDKISYNKGASIIRMMSHFLTEETFRKGLQTYLTDLSYGAAVQDDLWQHLTVQAHEDGSLPAEMTVKEVMETWTLQMGYPVVTVVNHKDGTADITQERFLLIKSENSMDDHDYSWWIPLTFTSKDNPDFTNTVPSEWMKKSEKTKIIQIPEGNQWIIFNLQVNGFYRINYDEDTWKMIAEQLKTDHEVISNLNRASIIDDSLNLARAGKLKYEIALDILSYIAKETDYIPLKSALQNMAYIKEMYAHTGGYGDLKKFFLSLIIPHYDQIQFADSISDLHLDQLKRADVLQWACSLGHQPCLEEAAKLFNNWMNEPDNYGLISPNVKDVVYCTAISSGGEDAWQFAWERYEAAKLGTEKDIILEALGCSSEIWILSSYLNRSLTDGAGVRKQDVRSVIPAIAGNSNGRLITWQFLRDQWSTIINYFGSVSFALDDIVSSVTKSLNTHIQLEEMKAFRLAEDGNFKSAYRSIEQATENIQNNLLWMNKYYSVIGHWLNEYNSK